jgi:hypothetical protein
MFRNLRGICLLSDTKLDSESKRNLFMEFIALVTTSKEGVMYNNFVNQLHFYRPHLILGLTGKPYSL